MTLYYKVYTTKMCKHCERGVGAVVEWCGGGGGRGGSDVANKQARSASFGLNGIQLKMGYFKWFRICWVNRVASRVRSTVFSHEIKKKKHVLPLGKSCNKLLNLRCITLNSPPISRKSSTQQIDICSIIIKLYKSANPNIANQNKQHKYKGVYPLKI